MSSRNCKPSCVTIHLFVNTPSSKRVLISPSDAASAISLAAYLENSLFVVKGIALAFSTVRNTAIIARSSGSVGIFPVLTD